MRPHAQRCGFRYPAELKAECVGLYTEGWSAGDLSVRYGCSTTIVREWVRAAGARTRRSGARPRKLPPITVLYRERGELGSWAAVARKHGVHRTTVLSRKDAQVVP